MALAVHPITQNSKNSNFNIASSSLASEDVPLEQEAFPGELAALRAQYSKNMVEQPFINDFLSEQHHAKQHKLADRLIEVMPTGLVVLDGNGIVSKINKVARLLLDEPILGQAWFDVIKRSFKPREDDWHEVSLKDGRRVKLEISSLGDQPGQLIMITDLTETRLLQDKIGQMQRLSSLGKMVSTLAHQIRTPLSAAILYGANLASHQLSDQARAKFQDKLNSRLKDLEQQVNDMLLFSKSGTEQVVSPIELNELLNDAVQGVEVLVNKAGAEVNVQLPNESGQVLGNKSALTGAIQNLIHNALQVIDDNAKVSIQVHYSDKDAYISVKDNGPGVSAEIKDKIFQPFFTSSSQGTGLGLAVVKSVINAHQGEVSLISQPGEGAHFILKLPKLECVKSTGELS
ncbi:PAS domain-containing sensor histidine kinase [Colwellia sp. RSH04]|uniref:sensor histidine kinase n=1 Tax=Colwellia sp. RSH04 TaxID=2305464 RepID=UPI000E5847CC|nr:HAMP domain-containing sensor histidine kinase [Colwellia sp. RSH04]RHW75979.1 sensor histidine kinase [Colwellia sp. RSH04]